MNSRRRVLVTGGAGFIGSRLVTRFASTDEVWVLDNLHPQVHGTEPFNPPWPDHVHFVKGDVRDKAAVEQLMTCAQPHLIVHLAAETGTGQSHDEIARYCEVNVTGTAHILEAARRHAKQSLKRIVLASSRAVYGEGPYADKNGHVSIAGPRNIADMNAGRFDVIDPNDGSILTPLPSHSAYGVAPSSIYGSTKLMQEYLVTQASMGESWSPVILRFQNVYGPGQSLRNPYTGVLSIFCSQLLAGQTLDVFEDGEIVRDFVYVDDVVDSLVAASQTETIPKRPIDIGCGERSTILEVVRMLLNALDCPSNQFRVSGKFRAGDIRYARADITYAKQAINWRPKTSLKQGLELLARWSQSESNIQEVR